MKTFKDIITEAKKDAEYEKFFQKKLKQYGITSPDELEKDKRKKFFDEVDKEWKADNEKD